MSGFAGQTRRAVGKFIDEKSAPHGSLSGTTSFAGTETRIGQSPTFAKNSKMGHPKNAVWVVLFSRGRTKNGRRETLHVMMGAPQTAMGNILQGAIPPGSLYVPQPT